MKTPENGDDVEIYVSAMDDCISGEIICVADNSMHVVLTSRASFAPLPPGMYWDEENEAWIIGT